MAPPSFLPYFPRGSELPAEPLTPSNCTREHCVHCLVPLPENKPYPLSSWVGLPLPPSHPLPQDKRIMGTLPRPLPKAQRGNGPRVVIGWKVPRNRATPPPSFLGRKRQGEEEKDRLFLHPQWDW